MGHSVCHQGDSEKSGSKGLLTGWLGKILVLGKGVSEAGRIDGKIIRVLPLGGGVGEVGGQG